MKSMTTTRKKPTTGVGTTPKNGSSKATQSATSTESDATNKDMAKEINAVLQPNGKSRVKRLQHAQILAGKFENMSNKYDGLTQFIAGNDKDNSNMKFASENGYTFTLYNPAVIGKVLLLVENEFSNHLKEAEEELLNFQI